LLFVHFVTLIGTNDWSARSPKRRVDFGTFSVLGKSYFVRQATTLLNFARSISDPHLRTWLVQKAADLKDNIDEAPSNIDVGPFPPDVETERNRPH
jgi:hypothetical protein